MGAKEKQAEIRDILTTMFDSDLVKSEWSVRAEATDDVYDKLSYAPRLDLAVGPFNVTKGRKEDDYQRRVEPWLDHPREFSLLWAQNPVIGSTEPRSE
jgi:hypothetical protein